jgi:hemerythrin-like metal-binding protein
MGIDELDQDHKRLLRVAETIAERVDNPDTDPKQWPFLVREGLKYMSGYYQSHIQREEAYMQQINYAHYESHKQVHNELEQTVSAYIDSQITDTHCQLDDVLKLLGATYGWQMIHIAMDDMAIVGKGTMARPTVDKLDDAAMLSEIDAMLGSLLLFDPKTKIANANYKGDGVNSAVCQKITYCVAGMDVTLILGMENTILRHAIEVFWGDKIHVKEIDQAHKMLLQWCLTSFVVGFWRDMISRFTHDQPCVLKDVSPMEVRDTRQMTRSVEPKHSTLYETTKGRFFVVCDH